LIRCRPINDAAGFHVGVHAGDLDGDRATAQINAIQIVAARLHSNVAHQVLQQHFSQVIARHVNQSFEHSTFPAKFRTAQVTPLLKNHGLDDSDPTNLPPYFQT